MNLANISFSTTTNNNNEEAKTLSSSVDKESDKCTNVQYISVFLLICDGWLKSSKADQDTLMECDQIWFIFQHHSSCSYRPFPSELQCLDLMIKKKNCQQQICQPINFSAYPCKSASTCQQRPSILCSGVTALPKVGILVITNSINTVQDLCGEWSFSFIAITPRSTLTQSGSTQSPYLWAQKIYLKIISISQEYQNMTVCKQIIIKEE